MPVCAEAQDGPPSGCKKRERAGATRLHPRIRSPWGGVAGVMSKCVAQTTRFAYDGVKVMGVIETTGAIMARYDYDAYGDLISTEGAEARGNPFRFSTKYSDDETGWVYYGFRFYSPELGRWINRDPILEWGDPGLYGFVNNDAINALDISGLWRWVPVPKPDAPSHPGLWDPVDTPRPPWIRPISPIHPAPYLGTGVGGGAYIGWGRERFSGRGTCCKKADTLIPQYTDKIEYKWTWECTGFGLGASVGVTSDPTPSDNTDCPPKNFEYDQPIDITFLLPLPGNGTPVSPGFGLGGPSLGIGAGITAKKHCKVAYSGTRKIGCCK